MKYSLRRSFYSRRRKEILDDDDDIHTCPRIDANDSSTSNLNLVKPVKPKKFLQRRRRHSSSSSPIPVSPDKNKSLVFEPRYDTQYDDDPFSSSVNPRVHPFNRLTYQIRKSFRNTLTRQRSRLESTNSNKRLIFNKTDEYPILYPISTGLTSPLTIPIENEKMKTSSKRRKAPLAPTHINQSISLPIEMTPEHEESISNNKQDLKKTNLNRSFRTRISLLLKKHHEKSQDENINHENHPQKSTLSQRFNSLRHSFHIGNRNSTNKGKRYLLSNE